MFEVAVRDTDDASVYVADAWFPMVVPAAVCALPLAGTNAIATNIIVIDKRDKCRYWPHFPFQKLRIITLSSSLFILTYLFSFYLLLVLTFILALTDFTASAAISPRSHRRDRYSENGTSS